MERPDDRNRYRHPWRPAGLAICAALLCLAGPAAAATLSIAVEDADNRPVEYTDESGRLTGFHIELVRSVCATLGWQPDFDLVPWQRAQSLLQRGDVDAVTYMVRSPEREAYALFLPDNLLSESLIELWILKSRTGEIRWEPPLGQMMARWRFGGIQGWFYNAEFRVALNGGGSVDMTATNSVVLARMLLAGRIDVAAASREFAMQSAGSVPEVTDLVQPLAGPVLRGEAVYIAFARRGDHAAKAQEFAKAYAAWRRTPEYRALVERFGLADRVDFAADTPRD